MTFSGYKDVKAPRFPPQVKYESHLLSLGNIKAAHKNESLDMERYKTAFVWQQCIPYKRIPFTPEQLQC